MEMRIWNRLCEKVNKKLNVSEGRFEKEIALEFLSALNWSEYYDNLKEQYQIDVHGDKWIPDFALFKGGNEEPVIIVELKKPSHKQRTKDRRQIATYMKLVDCRFGLYFGEKLELFFLDNEQDKRISKSVLCVDFIKNDKNGKKLIDLLKYESFDRNLLRTFCENQLKLEDVCRYWCSDEGRNKLYSFIMKESQLSPSLSESLQSSLEIVVTQKLEITEKNVAPVEENSGCVDTQIADSSNDDYFAFRLRETKKGTDARMLFYPREKKYVIKTGSKVSAKETKDCSPEARMLRKSVFTDSTLSRKDGNLYLLLHDVTIISKTGTPNVAGHFCTGRSTNAREAWIDEDGRSYGNLFSKNQKEEKTVILSSTKNSDDEQKFLTSCINRVSDNLGIKLVKKSGNAYISSDGKKGFVFRTSKIYPQGTREKYWYAYKRMKALSECQNQYYVFGCKDANTIVILPVSEIESQIEGLNYSQDGNGAPSYWHIVFLKDKDGNIKWLISKPETHEIDITNKLL